MTSASLKTAGRVSKPGSRRSSPGPPSTRSPYMSNTLGAVTVRHPAVELAEHSVVARPTLDPVASLSPAEHVVATKPEDPVVAGQTDDHVSTPGTSQRVVAGCPDDRGDPPVAAGRGSLRRRSEPRRRLAAKPPGSSTERSANWKDEGEGAQGHVYSRVWSGAGQPVPRSHGPRVRYRRS